MWGQCSSKYMATVGTQLMTKIHLLLSKVEDTTCVQNYPVDCLSDCIDFIGEVSDRVGGFVDKLNSVSMLRMSRSNSWPIWPTTWLERQRDKLRRSRH